jgi:CBS domain-containing protein
MKVREVMTTDVITVDPDTSFKDVVEVLLRNEVSGLPVVDADGAVVGMVTEADVLATGAYPGRRRRTLSVLSDLLAGRDVHWARKAAGAKAEDLMNTPVLTAEPGDDVRAIARAMVELRVKRLPVVEDGRLVGIVSRPDVLRLFDRSDAEIEADIRARLANPLEVPEDYEVRFFVHDGVVTLEGSVHHESDARVVEGMVERVRGVVRVESRLTFGERDPRLTGRLVPPLH